MKIKQEIKRLRRDIQSLKDRLKFIGFRMGVLLTNTFLIERRFLTREEKEWLLLRYRDDIIAIKILLNQHRDQLEFKVVTCKLYFRRKQK